MKGLKYGAFVAAALLLGAGCGAKTESSALGTIDAGVSNIKANASAEMNIQKQGESDGSVVTSDAAEVNAYNEASYELK